MKSNNNNNKGSNTEEKKSENNTSQNNTQVDNNTSNIFTEKNREIEALKAEIAKLRQAKIIESSQLKLEVTKYKVKIKSMTYEIEKLKQEKKEENMDIMKMYHEQIIKMQKEIEKYKSNADERNENEYKFGIDVQKFELLKKENALYINKLQEAQKKIVLANSLIIYAKKYNIIMSYLIKFFEGFTPSGEKQTYLFNKLKSFTEEFEKEKNSKKNE